MVRASHLTLLGPVLLPCTMASSLLRILRIAVDDTFAVWVVIGMVLWFALCWFALPIRCAARGQVLAARRRAPDHCG